MYDPYFLRHHYCPDAFLKINDLVEHTNDCRKYDIHIILRVFHRNAFPKINDAYRRQYHSHEYIHILLHDLNLSISNNQVFLTLYSKIFPYHYCATRDFYYSIFPSFGSFHPFNIFTNAFSFSCINRKKAVSFGGRGINAARFFLELTYSPK